MKQDTPKLTRSRETYEVMVKYLIYDEWGVVI